MSPGRGRDLGIAGPEPEAAVQEVDDHRGDQGQQNRDDLKWCGASPFYTFLKSVPGLRGELLHYEQWNIDEQSVVSFAGMAFGR